MPSGTRSVSTYQNAQVLDATHYLTVATFPLKVIAIEGYCGGVANTTYYLQLHSTAAPVSTTTVPIWSMPVYGTAGFSFGYAPDGIDTDAMTAAAATTAGLVTTGVYVAISSTQAVYTAVAISVDVRVDFEEYELEIANLSVTGDLTTNIGSRTVWLNNATASTKRLVKVEAINNNGTTQYLQLLAATGLADGVYPIQVWALAAAGTLILNFGRGITINTQNDSLVNSKGCVLQVSSTAQTKTAVANGWNIRATYLVIS